MKFLIDLWKKASKGDNFRPTESPNKYYDNVAQLNTTANNQASRLNTPTIYRIQKTKPTLTQNTSKGSVLPGK